LWPAVSPPEKAMFGPAGNSTRLSARRLAMMKSL
jgi:hypothetical protein